VAGGGGVAKGMLTDFVSSSVVEAVAVVVVNLISDDTLDAATDKFASPVPHYPYRTNILFAQFDLHRIFLKVELFDTSIQEDHN